MYGRGEGSKTPMHGSQTPLYEGILHRAICYVTVIIHSYTIMLVLVFVFYLNNYVLNIYLCSIYKLIELLTLNSVCKIILNNIIGRQIFCQHS